MRYNIIFTLILHFSLFTFHFSSAHAAPAKITFLLGDTYGKILVEATKEIKNTYPYLKDTVDFQILTSRAIMERGKAADLSSIAPSKTVVILSIMDSQAFERVKPYLRGKCYAVGGTLTKEHENLGLISDNLICKYYQENGVENIKNMVLMVMNRDLGLNVSYKEPLPVPDFGIYLKKSKTAVASFEDFLAGYCSLQKDCPWVGIVFGKHNLDSGNTKHLDFIIDCLENKGFNVLPVYGYPSEKPIEMFLFDEAGTSRVSAVIGMSLKVGMNPQAAIPILSRLGVPVINAITLYTQSREKWEKSPVGLDILERTWQVACAELGGLTQPTVIASKEDVKDSETGIEYVEERPIPERIDRLVDRVKAWTNLQEKPNKDKKVAIIYYNYPPGKQNIGAAYLNVLPESLWEILSRLKAEGYDIEGSPENKDELFDDIHKYGRNIGNWALAEIDRLARSGQAILIPINVYEQWFEELPEGFRKSVLKSWGTVERSKIMVWQGNIVIPQIKYGNILFTPQPSRGWEQDVKKLYHDVTLPPHHQYIAFYLWLKKGFGADAVAHIGTHGTHEWLCGKEVGFTDEDPSEVLIDDLPNIYPYIVDDVGEGLQAKRRGMAVVIDHMTPPFDKAGLNKELKGLAGLIDDYNVAKEKSPILAESRLVEINRLAKRIGILTDLDIASIKSDDELGILEHYIKEIAEKQTPFGLHTFGKSPDEKYRKSTAEAMLSDGLSKEKRTKDLAEMEGRILESGQRELDSFIAALAGRYIPAGPGHDPIRNPASLPTGKNFYSFNPSKIPVQSAYEMGVRLARELIEGYKQRHGIYPDKLTFNLWGVETIRHEGVMESQIMYLMGIKPKWDERGMVVGVEVLPRLELGRQRIDVTIVPSGLYRDLFSNLMNLLDKAVRLAGEQDEGDNILRLNMQRMKKKLMKQGILEDMAERIAGVRLFTVPSGAYGTNLASVIPLSNTWNNEKQVADVYFMRMSHLYGNGFWGQRIEKDYKDISLEVFKDALSGSKMAVHSRSGNVFQTLDNDDFFQYLGATAMAIRVIDGKTPEVYVTNMANPRMPKQETLQKMMGSEMRTRYLNPEWITAMFKEGYAGSRFVDKVVEHLWGWQVTVPEAVDAAKWNEMYETYVLDRNNLGIKDMFRGSKNMWAYQSVVARMLECVRKKYWKPEKEIIETLAREYAESVKEVGLACCDHTCNNPSLTKFTSNVLMSVPGLQSKANGFIKATKAIHASQTANDSRQKAVSRQQKANRQDMSPDRKDKVKPPVKNAAPASAVTGYEMTDVDTAQGGSSAPIPYLFLAGFLVFVGLVALGFRRK
ncbi:MAG: cobaltochelatase subunit CobN [bacterium]|nr:cobaltochelatase subunit CobN [bacterium]